MPRIRKAPPRYGPRVSRMDMIVRTNFLLRSGFLGSKLLRNSGQQYIALPEPDEDLENSELSDAERRQAIARERTRREGRA